MKKNTLSPREQTFCRLFLKTRRPDEAALLAGYPVLFARRCAMTLLDAPLVREEIARLKKQEDIDSLRSRAAAGLVRAALGDINDAVKLFSLGSGEFRSEADRLDLFSVSEIKMSRTGGVEIKFLDRIKALEALCRLSETEIGEDADQSGFFAALAASVRKNSDTAGGKAE